MPTPYPEEFRRDVIAVARQGDQSIAKVAKSFGISETCLARWLRVAERQEGRSDGPPPSAGGDLEAENREL
jgi:transposase